MVQLTCYITIGNLVFQRVSEVEIVSTWKELGDKATLKLYGWVQEVGPDGKLVGPLQKVEDLVKVGDRVEIKLGYDGQLRTEFTGYVAELKLTVPFEVRCEDEYFWLKRSPVNHSWRTGTTLETLLSDLVGRIKGPHAGTLTVHPSVPKLTLDGFRADRTTVAGVLAKIKEKYLVCAYFRGVTLFVGLPYTEFTSNSPVPGALAKYSWQHNVIDDDLTYKRKEDVRIKAKVVALHPDGKRTQTTAGDEDGEERTIFLRLSKKDDTKDPATLKTMAQKKVDNYKYDGYRGKLTSFGVPFVIHSGTADLVDARYPQRAGRYLVDSVRTTFGTGGFRREVELGKRVAVLSQ